VEWIRKHGDTFIDDGKGGDLASLRSFVEGDWFGYLTSMGKNGTWGDHTVLVASAMCFRLRVNVYSVAHPTEPLTIVAPPQSAAATAGAQHFPSVATVSLGHYPEVHYVSTRPEQSTEPTIRSPESQRPEPRGTKRQFAASPPSCANCGVAEAGSITLKPCSRCKAVVYCGIVCQAQHWKAGGHKSACK
jgi:hypothetical protein